MKFSNKLYQLYLLGIHILLAVMLVKSDFIEKTAMKIGILEREPELSAYYQRIAFIHKRIDASVPEGATIFIGDSMIQGLATSAVSEYSVNYGIGLDTTVGVINRIPSYKSIARAKAIVIAIGLNDMKRRKNSQIVENYQTLINLIPKNKQIIVSAILPIDETSSSLDITNKKIIELNTKLQTLSATYGNVTFVNSRNIFQAPDGNLKSVYHSGDGIHLSPAGYDVWINHLKNALSKI